LPKFAYLLACPDSFIVEEFMSEDVLRIINEMTGTGKEASLPQFYFKLKALELLYALFKSLEKGNNRYFSV